MEKTEMPICARLNPETGESCVLLDFESEHLFGHQGGLFGDKAGVRAWGKDMFDHMRWHRRAKLGIKTIFRQVKLNRDDVDMEVTYDHTRSL